VAYNVKQIYVAYYITMKCYKPICKKLTMNWMKQWNRFIFYKGSKRLWPKIL